MKEAKQFETKKVWVAWTNTDLTEGRGAQYPLAVCESRVTAFRIGKGKSVQGSNCEITEEKAIRFSGESHWLIPGRLHRPSKEDIEKQEKINKRKAIIARMKKAGFSDYDINFIKGEK